MAKAVNWNNFNALFGESFVRKLEMERKMRQDQEQFNRKMQFENRQMNLYTNIAQERNNIEKEQSLGTMYREGFTPDTETPQIKMFGQGLDYPTPPPPEPITQAEMFEEGGNLFERKFIGEGENKKVTDINILKGVSKSSGRGITPNQINKIEQTNKKSQANYNAIMGSPWLTVDELKSRGIDVSSLESVDSKGKIKYKYGGAYLYQRENGEPILFYTDKELKNYAERRAPETPNKWERKGNNDPLGIR